MPNQNQMKTAVLATKIYDAYKKHWLQTFNGVEKDAKESFKFDLMRSVLTNNAKKAIGVDDFNFVLTRSNAHKILEYHQTRYVRLDDQNALLMKIWAYIIMDVYGEKLDVKKVTPTESGDNRPPAQLDSNLFNNMFPILDNTLKVISALDLNQQQVKSMAETMDKYGYCSLESIEEKSKKFQEMSSKFKELTKDFEKKASALEKKNDELEAENKKYAKIFSKLKAAI